MAIKIGKVNVYSSFFQAEVRMRRHWVAVVMAPARNSKQPTRLGQSCRQRMRWVRGNLQVFLKEGLSPSRVRGALRKAASRRNHRA